MGIFSKIFGKKNQLGVDFGTSFLKIVELKKEGEKSRLENYALVDLASLHKDSLNIQESELIETLKQALSEAKIETRQANVSVPLSSSFSTIITVPFMSDKELADAISFEARQYIPSSAGEVSLDWIELSRDEIEKKIQVLLMAVPVETVNKYSRIAEGAGLELKSLEIESFSMMRSLVGEAFTGICCAVEIGYRSTNIVVIDKGRVVISHYYEAGGSEFSHTLKQSLNINEDRAEALKRNIGLAGLKEEKEISSLMYLLIDKILGEIQRTLNAYYKKYNRKVEKIILAGGTANMKGLVEYFNSQLGIETVLANSFLHIDYPPMLKPAIEELNPILSVAVGLALKEL